VGKKILKEFFKEEEIEDVSVLNREIESSYIPIQSNVNFQTTSFGPPQVQNFPPSLNQSSDLMAPFSLSSPPSNSSSSFFSNHLSPFSANQLTPHNSRLFLNQNASTSITSPFINQSPVVDQRTQSFSNVPPPFLSSSSANPSSFIHSSLSSPSNQRSDLSTNSLQTSSFFTSPHPDPLNKFL
jgi:hypothetical protein